MNPFEVYKNYLAVKRHFSSSYDYFKYGGETNASVNSFEARKDKIFFEKLAKNKNAHEIILSNLCENEKAWIKDLTSAKGMITYEKWSKIRQSLTYTFKNDLSKLDEDFMSNFIPVEGEHPNILQLYINGDITLETLCILCKETGALKFWKPVLDDPVSKKIIFRIEKYTPFVEYDEDKIQGLIP